MTLVDDLLNEAAAIRILGGQIVDATDIGTHAIELAVNNWAVGPLCRRQDHGPDLPHGKETIRGGRGVLDFTTDVAQVAAWWGGRYAGHNIGARVPESTFVLDVDNLDALATLEKKNGKLPETLTTISGRAAGGKHLYYRRPAAKLSMARLPKGVEIKTSTGYTVQPPSIHPDTGKRYTRIEAPVAAPPRWLVDLLLPERMLPRSPCRQRYPLHTGPSIADKFSASTSWADILTQHAWRCLDADPDADGARWLHPAATSACSATVRHGLLFVYSTNTPFDVTESGDPHGYTKFRAQAVLNHAGDMSAAARAIAGKAVT
jgi:hypothetical protein